VSWYAWRWWRVAWSVAADGTTRSDDRGEWLRLFGKLWILIDRLSP